MIALKNKGVSVYLSAKELEAVEEADQYLMGLYESAGDETAMADLVNTRNALRSIIEKAQKATRSTARREKIKAALRIAKSN